MHDRDVIEVRVVLALPDERREVRLSLAVGTSARAAARLAAGAGLSLRDVGLDADTVALGVHGRRVQDAAPLEHGDRLECYRPLLQDPMTRRRREAALSAGAARASGSR